MRSTSKVHDTRQQADTEVVVDVRGVSTRFGEHVVHSDLSFSVTRAEILALLGGSGSGKSTLLREMILLQRPDSGSIQVLGTDLENITTESALALRQRLGVMFQHGGLFGALTVLENVGLPLREHTQLSSGLIDDLARCKLAMTGLDDTVGAQYPALLSGGMLKRASLARALALDPELLFLDEPTAGLDPESAGAVQDLILGLRKSLRLSIVMITHDLDLVWGAADRAVVLGAGTVQGIGSMPELAQINNPAVRKFFDGQRGKRASTTQQPREHAMAPQAREVTASKPK